MVRGVELERVVLGVAQPGQQVGVYKDALRRLNDRLHYLNSSNNRFWFDTRPNLRREMEERKRRFQDKEDVFPVVRDRLNKALASSSFGGIHIFTPSGDVPDDWHLRLVVLPPDAAFSRSGQNLAIERAAEILKQRGEQPRFKKNRLIFLAADFDSVSRLKDQVRSAMAWQTIVNDIKEVKLNLDQFQAKQASKSLDDANDALRRMIREAYKWILAPVQEARPGKGISEVVWENFALNPGSQNFSQDIDRVLKENELLITEWAPIHLARVLKDWFWKDDVKEVSALEVWKQTGQQLYLPRLKDDTVFQATLGNGAASEDFFGFAQGKEGERYLGFSFGRRTSLILDESLILLEPGLATAHLKAQQEADAAKSAALQQLDNTRIGGTTNTREVDGGNRIEETPSSEYPEGLGSTVADRKTRFFGSLELDAIRAKKTFADVVDEVVQQFSARAGVKVRISIEIEADSPIGFDDGVQRAVKENCNVLKFKQAEFE